MLQLSKLLFLNVLKNILLPNGCELFYKHPPVFLITYLNFFPAEELKKVHKRSENFFLDLLLKFSEGID